MSTDTEIAAPRKKPARRRTLYRGDPGMWSWVLHRITGATIFFFLFVHVLDTALVRVSPEAYNEVVNTYKTPIIGLMEVGLVAAVLYHALNGIRVILIDFWAKGPKYQRKMLWVTRYPSGLRSGHGSSSAASKLPRSTTSKAIG